MLRIRSAKRSRVKEKKFHLNQFYLCNARITLAIALLLPSWGIFLNLEVFFHQEIFWSYKKFRRIFRRPFGRKIQRNIQIMVKILRKSQYMRITFDLDRICIS